MKRKILALGAALCLSASTPDHGTLPAARSLAFVPEFSLEKRIAAAQALTSDDVQSRAEHLLSDPDHYRRVEAAERVAQSRLPELRQYVSSHLASFDSLTRSPSEIVGTIDGTPTGFTITRDTHYNDLLLQYTDEFLRGDYSHTREFSLLGDVPVGQGEQAGYGAVLIQLYPLYAKNKADILAHPNDSQHIADSRTGKVVQTISNHMLGAMGKETEQRFVWLKKNAPMMSFYDPTALWKNPATVFRYHTHPKEDRNYQPSPPDRANSVFGGPGILFSQKSDTLHAYAIIRGEVTEFLTQKLR